MIAQELEVSLHMAFVEARQARHEFITVEHLLLALLDNPSAAEVLRACACNIEDLRKNLQNFIADNTPILPPNSEADTQPTLGFQRVIQRAIMHVQSHQQRQEGSHRRQRAGRHLRREGLARRVLPAPAGRDAARRRQFHLARHHQVAARREDKAKPAAERGSAGRRGQGTAVAARAVHAEPERARQGRQDRSADRPRARGRARDPGAVPPPQEQPAAGRRGRRRQDRHRRRPGLAHRQGRRARDPREVERLFARHGRAAGRHQVPRRLRAAPEGGAQAAEGQRRRDPVHRRDPHADRRRLRLGRHARRVEPAEAGAGERPAEVHRRDDLQRVPRHLREGPRAVAALPEDRRDRADGRADDRDPQGAQVALRGAPRRQVFVGCDHRRGRAVGEVHQRPPPARQGDRRDRRGRRGAAHPAEVEAEEDHRQDRGRGHHRQDRAHPAADRVERTTARS